MKKTLKNQIRKETKSIVFGIIAFLYLVSGLYSQDPVYTQYYQAPLQINPAFAGNTYAPVIHLNSRVEWPAINFAYNTYSFSVDRFYNKYNIGAGVNFMMDNSGNGIYKRFRMEGIFSYKLKIAEGSNLKMGLSIAWGNNNLDWEKLVFGDMIDPASGFTLPDGSTLPTRETRPENLTVNYADLSAGLLYNTEMFYVGVAVKHANSPKNFYFSTQDNVNKGLPVRFSVQLGGEIDITYDNVYLKRYYAPSILYVSQSGLNQLVFNNFIDLGLIFAGIGYRHDFSNSDAVLFSVGVSKEMFKIGYSFDYTVSKLSISSGGSHEIGVTINFDKSTLFEKPYRYSDCFNMYR